MLLEPLLLVFMWPKTSCHAGKGRWGDNIGSPGSPTPSAIRSSLAPVIGTRILHLHYSSATLITTCSGAVIQRLTLAPPLFTGWTSFSCNRTLREINAATQEWYKAKAFDLRGTFPAWIWLSFEEINAPLLFLFSAAVLRMICRIPSGDDEIEQNSFWPLCSASWSQNPFTQQPVDWLWMCFMVSYRAHIIVWDPVLCWQILSWQQSPKRLRWKGCTYFSTYFRIYCVRH